MADGKETVVTSRSDKVNLPHDFPEIKALQKALNFYSLACKPQYDVDGMTPNLKGFQSSMINHAIKKLDDIRHRLPNAGGLVIAPSIEMAEYMSKILEIIEGEKPIIVHSQMTNSEYKINPYKFGLVGASDTHTGAISDKESDFHSKIGILDGTPELRGAAPLTKSIKEQIEGSGANVIINGYKEIGGQEFIDTGYTEWGASGLAAVWAEDNTRESIYNAFRRKETFATTGSRIKVRFFGGYEIDDVFNKEDPINYAYLNGVTMGSDLFQSENKIPQFMVWALRDLKRAPLDRVQIIKGWTELSGKPHEKIYDVACADGRRPDSKTKLCRDTRAKVNLINCRISKNFGADELKAVWQDPDFDPNLKAFYYVRVLENPTCRWSSWDAIKSGEIPRADLPATIQERAWSSPIWYIPDNEGITIGNILPDDI